MCVLNGSVLTHARVHRLGRYLLRDVDETLRTVTGIVLDAAVVPGIFNWCDARSGSTYICRYVSSRFVLDGMMG